MIYFCKFLKSKQVKEEEKSMKSAINQVFRTFDVSNIVKNCQAMKLFKETVFENHQKIIFEQLLKPIVIGNQIRSPYDNEFIESLPLNTEEILKKKKTNLKAAFTNLADNKENSDEVDLTIQRLLLIGEGLRADIFKKDDKFDSIQKSFWRKLYINN